MPSAFGETPLGLASQILNLAGVLTRRATLKVPRYQRPYTWTEREVRQLIQDLRRAYQREATYYFIGQIVLVKNEGKLEISDGQQRLATLTMIIAYVRDRLPHRAAHFQSLVMSEYSVPRLLLRDDDTNFYLGFVQEAGKMAELAAHNETGLDSRDALIGAARTIAAEMQQVTDQDLERFMSYIARCATFNVVDADERGAAAGIYNAMNNTGQDLSAADNIKCDLLESSRFNEADASAAAHKWEETEGNLGRSDFALLIKQLPFMLTGAQLISPGDLGAFRAQIEAAGGVRHFLFDTLPRYGEALSQILRCDAKVGAASAEVNRRIKMMMQLEEWRWQPAALVFLAEHSGKTQLAVDFFQALERFAYFCELSVVRNEVREQRFEQAMRMCGEERAFHARGPLAVSNPERLGIIDRVNRASKVDKLRRLLLMRVEAALPGGSVLWKSEDATVEHILPRGSSPWWDPRFPDKGLRAEACNMLGNMTLITRAQNQEADNKSFPEKKRIYFHWPNAPIHALTRMIEHVDEWTFDVIEERHELLVRRLFEDWGVGGDERD